MNPPGQSLVPLPPSGPAPGRAAAAPALVRVAGKPAGYAWEEFFAAQVRNPHTRSAYRRAVSRFLAWAEPEADSLAAITPGHVGRYLDALPLSTPSKKLHLAALRAFFDRLVIRHVVVLNPAASVRGERYEVVEGKTPEMTADQVRALMKSLKLVRPVRAAEGRPPGQPLSPGVTVGVPWTIGLRDRAVIATLLYTAARAGAVARLRMGDLTHDGTQYLLRFAEKGGKSREIPVRHNLEGFLVDYLEAAGLNEAPRERPLFRSADRRTGRLTENGLTGQDVCRMVKRRLRDAGLPPRLSPHSFRVATITDLLTQGVALGDVQYLAGHADPRTTRLYDRRPRRVTRNLVERISI